MDLPFVLSNLASLTALPVRIVVGGKIEKRYSVVSFPIDPFSFHLKEVEERKSHVSFFYTKDFFYYGILRKGEERIVIGPASQVTYSPSRLREILFRRGVSNHDIPLFLQSLSALPAFPLTGRTRVLLMVNYIWNEEKLTPEEVLIQNEVQNQIQENRTSDTEAESGNEFPHNTYAREQNRLGYVKEGDIAGLKKRFSEERPLRTGTIAQTPLRQRKNRRVVTTTLVSRTCIEGGRSVEEALSLSDSYLQRRERLTTATTIQNLSYHRIRDYAGKRSEISGSDKYSRTIQKAIAYIQHNVNKKISAEDIAKEVYLSKNRLEIRFKEETGKTLHDYSRETKRKEAKSLLLNTKQTIEQISSYLCFSSQAYFQNVFRKRFNRTPRQFRENKKE